MAGLEARTCRFRLEARLEHSNSPGRLADGRNRPVDTFNGIIPGPLLVVCQDDIVEVTLVNMLRNSTTVHFHGIRHVGVMNKTSGTPMPGYEGFGPWSEGASFVDQCPIARGRTRLYRFRAGSNPRSDGEDLNGPPGTYWYHSHTGHQRSNGLQGGLVIKDKEPRHSAIDNPGTQTIFLQEWYSGSGCNNPVSILVNGKSRLSDKTLDCDKKEALHYFQGLGGSFPRVSTPAHQDTAYEQFRVEPGQTYRFRVVGAIVHNFPLRLSIDDHTFTVIAADSLYIEPIQNITYLWLSSGERYDILVKTKDHVPLVKQAFKMRVLGFTKITDSSTALCSIAWLRYPGQTVDEDYITPSDCTDFDRLTPDHYPPAERTVNPPGLSHADWEQRLTYHDWKDKKKVGSIYPVDMRSESRTDTSSVSKTEFIDLVPIHNLNGIKTTSPRVPFLMQSERISDRCNVSSKEEFSSDKNGRNQTEHYCPHVLQVPFNNQWLEIILVGGEELIAHPIHQHGGWFWVVGGGKFDFPVNRTFMIDLHSQNRINYITDTDRHCSKDVVQLPRNGYVVLRTHLDNPGFWLFHCHFDLHLRSGMALVLQIGEPGDWNLEHYKEQLDVPCEDTPPHPHPRGGFFSFMDEMMHEISIK